MVIIPSLLNLRQFVTAFTVYNISPLSAPAGSQIAMATEALSGSVERLS
jgi:hypothetical protein